MCGFIGIVNTNYLKRNEELYIKFNKALLRPAEVDTLRADYKKARRILKWKPVVKFNQLVKEMVIEDLKSFK